MVKTCCFFDCTSSQRTNHPGLRFVPFPKHFERCAQWAKLCGRDQFFVEKVDRHTYICEKHFHKDQELDWKKNPDLEPIPYGSNPFGSDEVTKIGKFKYMIGTKKRNRKNPWEVDSIQDFFRLKCPECAFFSQHESSFQKHAVKNHALSHILFSKNNVQLSDEESTYIDPMIEFDVDQSEFDADQNKFDVDRNEFDTDISEFDTNQNEFDVDLGEFGADTAGKKDSNSTENEIISVEEGLGMSENKPKLKKIYARNKQKHFSLAKSNNQCIETQATSNYNVNLTVQEEKINLDYTEFEDTMIPNPMENVSIKKEIIEKSDIKEEVNIDLTTHADQYRRKVSKSVEERSNPKHFEVQDFASIPTKNCQPSTSSVNYPIDVKIKQERCDGELNNDTNRNIIENSSIKNEMCEEENLCDFDNSVSKLNYHIDVKEEICDDTDFNHFNSDLIDSKVGKEYIESTIIKKEIKDSELNINKSLDHEDPLNISDLNNYHKLELSDSNLSSTDFQGEQFVLKKNKQKKERFKCGYFKCPFCPIAFEYFDSVNMHIGRLHGPGKTQRKENLGKCEACFSDKKSLSAHISKDHSQVSINMCQFCGLSYKCQNNLKEHIAKVHKGNPPEPVKTIVTACSQCSAIFKGQKKLKECLYITSLFINIFCPSR